MLILFDQGTPAPLKNSLKAHFVSTAFELGWSKLTNRSLLAVANKQFDVLVTTDQSLLHQQNLSKLTLAILVLPHANWPSLKRHIPLIVSVIDGLQPGERIALASTWQLMHIVYLDIDTAKISRQPASDSSTTAP